MGNFEWTVTCDNLDGQPPAELATGQADTISACETASGEAVAAEVQNRIIGNLYRCSICEGNHGKEPCRLCGSGFPCNSDGTACSASGNEILGWYGSPDDDRGAYAVAATFGEVFFLYIKSRRISNSGYPKS